MHPAAAVQGKARAGGYPRVSTTRCWNISREIQLPSAGRSRRRREATGRRVAHEIDLLLDPVVARFTSDLCSPRGTLGRARSRCRQPDSRPDFRFKRGTRLSNKRVAGCRDGVWPCLPSRRRVPGTRIPSAQPAVRYLRDGIFPSGVRCSSTFA